MDLNPVSGDLLCEVIEVDILRSGAGPVSASSDMLTYLRTSLFDSPAQTLVNTVNTVGVMGKGIAKEFKQLYPRMFSAYKTACLKKELQVGRLQLWRDDDHWVLNFPTKTTWKKPSEIDYVRAGLETFVSSYKEMGISSVAFPPLGCGNGGLEWSDVRPIMEHYLRGLDLSVYIHDKQVSLDFVPEHKDSSLTQAPSSFEEFTADIREQLNHEQAGFDTISGGYRFLAKWLGSDGIVISREGVTSWVRPEHLEWAWSALQGGMLTSDQYPSDDSLEAKKYLFAILIRLPYVRAAEIEQSRLSKVIHTHGLYFDRTAVTNGRVHAVAIRSKPEVQLCLSHEF